MTNSATIKYFSIIKQIFFHYGKKRFVTILKKLRREFKLSSNQHLQ